MEVDQDSSLRTKTVWMRLLVKLEGTNRPSVVNVLEGSRSFELQILWELSSWIIEVYPLKICRDTVPTERGKEEEGDSLVDKRVRI